MGGEENDHIISNMRWKLAQFVANVFHERLNEREE